MGIAENIKAKRLAAGLTQTELAGEIGVDQSLICQIERGSKTPNLLLAAQIAQVFGCMVDDLLRSGKTA